MDNNYNSDPGNNYNGQNNNGEQSGYSDAQSGYSNAQNGYNNPYNAPDFYSNVTNNQFINDTNKVKATASMVLGICSLIAWCLPILGIPCSIVGLTLGLKSKDSSNRGMAIAGIVMSSIGLGLSLINSIAGVILRLR